MPFAVYFIIFIIK